MVKVAIAGGTGSFAREIVDVLAATKQHEILVLTRKEPSDSDNIPGVTLIKADYASKSQLIEILKGVETVLSFIGTGSADPGSVSQKNLIDASIAAGVKRFAPNEWSSGTIKELPWYAEKGVIREYLASINKDKKVIEYTLFQPGLIVDYLGPPGAATSHITHNDLWIDFAHRRAITMRNNSGHGTLTTMHDLTHIVSLALSSPLPWPVHGGIQGATLPISQIIDLGKEIRGNMDVTELEEEDVRKGVIKSEWIPKFVHPGLDEAQLEHFSKVILRGSLLSAAVGDWVVGDEWNKVFPEYGFEDPVGFLRKHWEGKA